MRAALDGTAQQSRLLQHLHVLGGGGEGHVEGLGQLAHGARAAGQPPQHGPAGGIAQRAEHTIKRGGLLFNHTVEHRVCNQIIQPKS